MTFTTKNVQRAVQEVKDTDSLARYLRVPDSKRDEIKAQFSSGPQQVNAYIDYFMRHNPLASWRAVIVILDILEEKEAADAIRHLAEPVTGRACYDVSRGCVQKLGLAFQSMGCCVYQRIALL